jgi:cytochrome bd-type quinol oxidase subunit 2
MSATTSARGHLDAARASDEPISIHSSSTDSDAAGDPDRTERWTELRWALAGGGFAAAGVIGVAALVGRVSAFEARRLVEGIKPTATFAASTYIGAGATVLALMATVISFSITHESEFRRSHYRRLRIIAASTTALIIVALALLTCLVVPIAAADAPDNGYLVLYWAIVGLGGVGAGLTVAIVLMLNYAVRGLVDLGMEGTSFLVVDDAQADDPEADGTDPADRAARTTVGDAAQPTSKS